MVVVVGALLAFTASSLKPTITENERIEKQQNILYAMGINENDESSANFVATTQAPELFTEKVSEQLVLESKDGEIISQMTRKEFMDANNGKEPYLINIKKQKSNAKSGGVRKLPLFIGNNKEGKKVYVAPIYGKGLWDAIWGYVAVDENMVVQGAYFDHKGETPG
ncbi:Na(+)-translocating NADH-quinone reductase subunit C [Jejuia pallidilutea]|nr:Na(+)-translocating NADH-quinone reductase subunit C [Jejuia pallidilutea]